MKNTKSNLARLAKRAIGTIAIPVVVLIFFLVACAIKGVSYIAPRDGMKAFIYTVVTAVFTAYALGLHFFAGRFDFSLGATSILSAIIGAKIAIALGANSFAMIFIFLVVGAALGALSGFIYILFNLPPIITSLGVALAYEGLGFVISKGAGVNIATYGHMLSGDSIPSMIIITVIGIAVVFVIFNYTRYGYNYRAIQFGQKIAVETGLNEKRNAFLCYILCGMLIAVVGYFNISHSGMIAASVNLQSSGSVFGAMLALFIGGIISRYCEQIVAIALGCLTSAMITQGLSSLGLSSQAMSLINSLLTLSILAYSIHSEMLKKRIRGLTVLLKKKESKQQ